MQGFTNSSPFSVGGLYSGDSSHVYAVNWDLCIAFDNQYNCMHKVSEKTRLTVILSTTITAFISFLNRILMPS